jgi:predicted ATPase
VPDPAAYPWSLPVVRALTTLELHPSVTFLVGENGTGKSTLVEAVAVALGLNAEGGSEHLRFSRRRVHDLVRDGSQFLIATHSPLLLAYPEAAIYVIDEDGIARTAYEDTEHYRLTRAFLEAPERFLRPLLED